MPSVGFGEVNQFTLHLIHFKAPHLEPFVGYLEGSSHALGHLFSGVCCCGNDPLSMYKVWGWRADWFAHRLACVVLLFVSLASVSIEMALPRGAVK